VCVFDSLLRICDCMGGLELAIVSEVPSRMVLQPFDRSCSGLQYFTRVGILARRSTGS